jgi:hypothetical protein
MKTSLALIAFCSALTAVAQFPDQGPPPDGFGPGGPPPLAQRGPGPGGPGGPMQQEIKLLGQFDKDGDKRLNAAERKAAREFAQKQRAQGPGSRGPGGRRSPGGPGFRGPNENAEPPHPGPKLSPTNVKAFRDAPLYDPFTLRTLFLEFESADWEKELADFHHTDVEVPAKLIVDGKTYSDVGVHFRGASSYFMTSEGRKRSLNLSLDFVHEDQRLYGYRTLNLLNSAADPTLLCGVLYLQIAREYIPAPKANFVRVAINGESWGVYPSVQQFNKDFVAEWFGTKKGARWKAPGSPNGRAGLEYLGEDVTEYKRRFEIKSKDDPKAWADLIRFCRVINQTPPSQLEAALAPLLDIDGTLKFLALENVFINTDGYWTRASDFSLYQDEQGRFHIIPYDANETFRPPEGPGRDRQGSGGVALDPLVAANDARKPLLSKLLAVPSLRARYLGYVRAIAEKWLDWDKLGPLARRYHALIAADVKADTRKLQSYEPFTQGLEGDVRTGAQPEGFRGPRQTMSLKSFVEQRRAFLLNHPDIRKSVATAAAK